MLSTATPPANLDALLRAACRRALGLGLSFIDQIRAYRSILALAREVRVRCGGSLFDAGNQTLAALLADVCECACALGLDPDLPFPDAILVQRLAVRLSRASRQAGEPVRAGRMVLAQQPMQREKPMQHDESGHAGPAEPMVCAQDPMHREKRPQPANAAPAEPMLSAQDPIHREDEEEDFSLSAWRNDHKTERDQRAYEKLRTVIDERLIKKVKAMNQRDREEREAAERAAAA